MTSVRVRLLPSIIKAMVRASKSLVVGWGGGLFDYSVSPGPFLDLDLDLELDNRTYLYHTLLFT